MLPSRVLPSLSPSCNLPRPHLYTCSYRSLAPPPPWRGRPGTALGAVIAASTEGGGREEARGRFGGGGVEQARLGKNEEIALIAKIGSMRRNALFALLPLD